MTGMDAYESVFDRHPHSTTIYTPPRPCADDERTTCPRCQGSGATTHGPHCQLCGGWGEIREARESVDRVWKAPGTGS